MSQEAPGNDVAVFFDFENISFSLQREYNENSNFEALMDHCLEYGRVVLARAYADWSRHNPVIPPLQASGFDPIYVPTYFYARHENSTRKNAVDIHIAIEAIEVLYTRAHVNTFILLTGDKDFIPLAHALRRQGKQVVAIGVQGTTSPYLQQAVDAFMFYHQILSPRGPRNEIGDIYEALVEAVKLLQRTRRRPMMPNVKHTMSELLGGFDEKEHRAPDGSPFRKFKDFILEAERQGLVQLLTTGTVNEVLLPRSGARRLTTRPAVPPTALAQTPTGEATLDEGDGDAAPPDDLSLEQAYELLVAAVERARRQDKSFRAASIKSIMRSMNHGFDEKKLIGPDGKRFARFTDFTRAAEKLGLVTLSGRGKYIEIHPPAATPVVEATVAEGGEASPSVAPDGVLDAASKLGEAALSEAEARAFMLDALRAATYPAPALPIDRHCLAQRDARGTPLPDGRVRQLLARAVTVGLLRPTAGTGSTARPSYELDDSAAVVARFTGVAEAEGR